MKPIQNQTSDLDCNNIDSRLPPKTKQYYQRVCQLQNEMDINWKDQLAKLGEGIVNLPFEFLQAMLTPEGIETMGLFLGIDIGSKAAMNIMLRTIARGIGPEVMAEAQELAIAEGFTFVNNTLLVSVLTEAVEEASVSAVALQIVTSMGEALEAAASVFAIVQILVAILDSWDPEGYGNMLDGSTMKILNEEFDRQFQIRFMNQVPIGRDKYGNPIHSSSWPIKYKIPLNNTNKIWHYVTEYLSALDYNSDGQPLKPRKAGGTIIGDLNLAAQRLAREITDSNTNAIIWIHNNTWWMLLLLASLLFLKYIR